MRRRRRSLEPVFGFDSFVDLITNLVGIVLRLIIVVLMGVHLNGGFKQAAAETALAAAVVPEEAGPVADASGSFGAEPEPVDLEPEPPDPEVERYQAEIAGLQGRLLETLRALDLAGADRKKLQARAEQAGQRRTEASQRAAEREKGVATHRQSIAEAQRDVPRLRDRLTELQQAIKAMEDQPPEKRVLRFHLPVSRPVEAEELIFECQSGRVTFADLQALLEQVQRDMPTRAEELRTRWSVSDTAGPAGAFELHYVIERERRSSLDQLALSLAQPPAEDRQFRYGLGKWELRPVWPVRGDPAADALKDGSRFRNVVDALDPEQVVLTFFVYPDSFDLFRELRDYLHERGFVVAGRPLPSGYPIYGSKTGSVSRGQ